VSGARRSQALTLSSACLDLSCKCPNASLQSKLMALAVSCFDIVTLSLESGTGIISFHLGITEPDTAQGYGYRTASSWHQTLVSTNSK
jgi:hypothetical protein